MAWDELMPIEMEALEEAAEGKLAGTASSFPWLRSAFLKIGVKVRPDCRDLEFKEMAKLALQLRYYKESAIDWVIDLKPELPYQSREPGAPQRRGRKLGSGLNDRILKAIKPGQTVFGFDKKRAEKVRKSSYRLGIKVNVLAVPNTNEYAIERVA